MAAPLGKSLTVKDRSKELPYNKRMNWSVFIEDDTADDTLLSALEVVEEESSLIESPLLTAAKIVTGTA